MPERKFMSRPTARELWEAALVFALAGFVWYFGVWDFVRSYFNG